MGKVDVVWLVEPHHKAWLEQSLVQFNIPDFGKGMRCLLTYIMQVADPDAVFGKTRCKSHHGQPGKVEQGFAIESEQQKWLQEMIARFSLADEAKAARICLEYGVVETDPQEVFGVVRKHCTHGPGCTKCHPPKTQQQQQQQQATKEGVRVGVVLVGSPPPLTPSSAECIAPHPAGPSQDDFALLTTLSLLDAHKAHFQGLTVAATKIVPPGDKDGIQRVVREWVDPPETGGDGGAHGGSGREKEGVELVLVAGGCGFSPGDVATEAVKELMHRPAEGITAVMLDAMNPESAMLARPVAGIRFESIILNMPSDIDSMTTCLVSLLSALPHGIKQLRGEKEQNHPKHLPHDGSKAKGCGCDH